MWEKAAGSMSSGGPRDFSGGLADSPGGSKGLSWSDVLGTLTAGPNGGYMDDGLGGLTTTPDEEEEDTPVKKKKKFDLRAFLTPQQGGQQAPNLSGAAGGAVGRAVIAALKLL